MRLSSSLKEVRLTDEAFVVLSSSCTVLRGVRASLAIDAEVYRCVRFGALLAAGRSNFDAKIATSRAQHSQGAYV